MFKTDVNSKNGGILLGRLRRRPLYKPLLIGTSDGPSVGIWFISSRNADPRSAGKDTAALITQTP